MRGLFNKFLNRYMQKKHLGQATLAALLLCAISGLAQAATLLHGKVVRVADGDTITVLDSRKTQHKIRLQGIDAPESRQAFGTASKKSLAELVAGQQVEVRLQQRDRYDRWLGTVWVAEPSCRQRNCPFTVDVGHVQLTRGMAWWYRAYAKEQSPQEASAYRYAEKTARARKVGLWQSKKPMPPWTYRRKYR